MRYQFIVSQGAKADMLACKEKDPKAAAEISTILREVLADDDACDWLVNEGYQDDQIESIVKLSSFHSKRINAYRVKLVEFRGWRLITVVDHASRRLGLMAVMPRKDDYETHPTLWPRIEREYDDYGFARY